jgi:hypothetical protein
MELSAHMARDWNKSRLVKTDDEQSADEAKRSAGGDSAATGGSRGAEFDTVIAPLLLLLNSPVAGERKKERLVESKEEFGGVGLWRWRATSAWYCRGGMDGAARRSRSSAHEKEDKRSHQQGRRSGECQGQRERELEGWEARSWMLLCWA